MAADILRDTIKGEGKFHSKTGRYQREGNRRKNTQYARESTCTNESAVIDSRMGRDDFCNHGNP